MNNHEMNPTETSAEGKHNCVAALSNDEVGNAMRTTPSENEFENYGSIVDAKLSIARSKIRGLIY